MHNNGKLPRKIRHLYVFIQISPTCSGLRSAKIIQKQSVFLLCTQSPEGKPAGIGCRWLHLGRRMGLLTVSCSVCMIKQQSMVSCASLAIVTGRSMILPKYLPFFQTKVTLRGGNTEKLEFHGLFVCFVLCFFFHLDQNRKQQNSIN